MKAFVNKAVHVFSRELHQFSTSAMAYLVLAVFAFFGGLFYINELVTASVPNLALPLQNLGLLTLFTSPFLAMRLFSEEKKQGTHELVLTHPLSAANWVTGKSLFVLFLAFTLAALSLTWLPLLLMRGSVDLPLFILQCGSYFLLLKLSLQISLWASAQSKNQLVAALLALSCLLGSLFVGYVTPLISIEWLSALLGWLDIFKHYTSLLKGLFSLKALAFFLVFDALFFLWTVAAIESEDWR